MFIGDLIERYSKKLGELKTAFAKSAPQTGFSSTNSTSMVPQTGSPVNSSSLQKQSMAFPTDKQNPAIQRQLSIPEPKMNLGQQIQAGPSPMMAKSQDDSAIFSQGVSQSVPDYQGTRHPEADVAFQENMNNMVMGSTGEMVPAGKALKPVVRSLADDAAAKLKSFAKTLTAKDQELVSAAKQSKSLQEFIESQFNKKPSYGMDHRPSWDGTPPAYDLLEGGMLPRDVYDKPEWSIVSGRKMSDPVVQESWSALQKIRNKPDAEITVYRASPKNELNTGDWVSFSKKYAEGEGAQEGTKVFPHKVKASDIVFGGDDINEFGYFPKSRLTDIWNVANMKSAADDAFTGLKDLSTKIVEKLKGKKTVSKQFITDLTNSGDVKQVERDMIRKLLEKEGDKIEVSKFADKVGDELLPLERGPVRFGGREGGFTKPGDVRPPKYESVTLPSELRGNVQDYREVVYQSPIKTSAGNTHFSTEDTPKYFGHTRVEDMADGKTRRVIEVQSDLYQKGNLEKEVGPGYGIGDRIVDQGKSYKTRIINDSKTGEDLVELIPDTYGEKSRYISIDEFKKMQESRTADVKKLSQYNDPTAHFRMVREEVKKAAQDGKSELLFPTGETAMKVEGLGETQRFITNVKQGKYGHIEGDALKPSDLKPGIEIRDPNVNTIGSEWIVTEVIGDGKFKAVPKNIWESARSTYEPGGIMDEALFKRHKEIAEQQLRSLEETFDISGKVDQNNPIYKFYEKEMSKYLKSKYGAQQIVDENGVSWMKVPIKPEYSKAPVEAFVAPIVAGAGAAATAKKKSDEKKKSPLN